METLDEIKNNSRCLSDRVLNYIEYGRKKLGIELDQRVLEFYKVVRDDGDFLTASPRVRAGVILYADSILRNDFTVTQDKINDILKVSHTSIRVGYRKLLTKYTKDVKRHYF